MIFLTDTMSIAAALRAGMSPIEVADRFKPTAEAKRILDLCIKLGSPPADALERLSLVEADWGKALADLEVAASGPKSSAKLVTLLPVIVLAGAQLLGLKIFNHPNPLTLASIGVGSALLFAGHLWSKRILNSAKPSSTDPGAVLDAFSVALSSGLSPSAALQAVAEQGDTSELHKVIELSSSTGLAIAKIARAEADQLRLRSKVEMDTRIRAAAVRLMWPLGLTVLPAFVLVAVIPLALAMLQAN